MNVPENVTLYETPLAINWLCEDNIMHSISKNAPHTLSNMEEHFSVLDSVLNGKKVPFLIDPSDAKPVTAKERRFLNENLQNFMTCVAFVTQNTMMKIGVNLYFRIRPQFLPMKMFASEENARLWLKDFSLQTQNNSSN